MWRLAAVVACLAILIGYLSATGNLPSSSDDVGNLLFEALGADITGFAIPFAFSRFTLPPSEDEQIALRTGWTVLVGGAAFLNRQYLDEDRFDSFAIVLGVQTASYLFMLPLAQNRVVKFGGAALGTALVALVVALGCWDQGLRGMSGITCAWFLFRIASKRAFLINLFFAVCGLALGILIVPPSASLVVQHLMPVDELGRAYRAIAVFLGAERLAKQSMELFLVTLNVQVPLGYLGIRVLRCSQARQNDLLQVGEGKVGASTFVRRAVWYVSIVAVPYLLQRSVMENVNTYVSGRFNCDVQRSLRVDLLLPEGQDSLLGVVAESNFTAGTFADSLHKTVTTSYQIIQRKLFSLPKLALLPGMLWRKPVLVATVIPGSIGLDYLKSQLTALLSGLIESLSNEIQELADRRRRVEQHDTKREELIRRTDAGDLVRAQWQDLTDKLAELHLRWGALGSLRDFINYLYWEDIMVPGLECALGFLLEIGHITNVDIWVYQRSVEDAIDTLLMRSRAQAQLTSMEMHVGRLEELSASVTRAQERGKPQCEVDVVGKMLRFSRLQYSRGSSLKVHIPELSMPSGQVYAVTGANGCGKSTIFGILTSCGSRPTMLPDATELDSESRIVLPSDDVAEITQQLYCPLFYRPIAWLLQRPQSELPSEESLVPEFERVRRLSADLHFHGGNVSEGLSQSDLYAEKEDWCSELSGGQRVKVELMRQVFLADRCPGVLLLDEAFAPLDPDSKAVVQAQLKVVCPSSLVLVIFHTDAGERCVRGGGFFDGNIHFENGTAQLVDMC